MVLAKVTHDEDASMTLQDCNQWLYLIIVSGDAGDDFRGWHHRGSFINDKDKIKEIG